MRWVPTPQLCKDKFCFIIGGGFSVQYTDLSSLFQGRHFVIGVNNAFSLGDWVNICWFGDRRWHEWNEEELKLFKGVIACCHPSFEGHGDIRFLMRGKSRGIDEREGYIAWNSCSGSSAINLAYHLGSRRVVLIGFDMKPTEIKDPITGEITVRGQWHQNHKVDYLQKGYSPYTGYLAALPFIAKDAKRLGVEVLNATIDTAIPEDVFEKARLEDVV